MDMPELLSQVPLFSSLGSKDLAALAGKLRLKRYRRGDTIFHKDDPGSSLYIIKEGQVKIATPSPDGHEAILAILTANDFFGELAILDGQPRSTSAVAMEATEAFVLHRDDFLEACDRRPKLARHILAVLAGRLRHADRVLEAVVFLDLPRRLARRLLELSERHGVGTSDGVEINLRLTQQDLADSIGSSREAVNKVLGALQDSGLVSIVQHHIVIRRTDDLEKLAY
jgi:CRP/FNR family transcriptional regulator/CRP/FNR family cyclic AMP-dependent transcriptional regulator